MASSSSPSDQRDVVDWSDLDLLDVLPALPQHPLLPIPIEFTHLTPQSGSIRLPAYLSVPMSRPLPHIRLLPAFAEARRLLGLPVSTAASEGGDCYSLLTLDPDALSKTKHWFRSGLHFMHVNITDVTENCLKTGTDVAHYEGAGPPPFCGYHRYIFLLFYHSQPVSLPLHSTDFPFSTAHSVPRMKRPKFSVERFLSWFAEGQKPQLVAVNYYLASHWMQYWWGNPKPKIEEIPLKYIGAKANEAAQSHSTLGQLSDG